MVESEFARQLNGHGVSASECVAVVLNKPEIVLTAELKDGGDREGITQSVGDHDGLGFSRRVCGLQLLGADVSSGRVVIDKHGYGSGLDNRRNGGRKPCGDGDHLVAGLDAFVRRQLVGSECGEGDEIGRGARIDEQGVADAKERGELFLEGLALGAKREPEIQSGRDGGLHFVFRENAAGVRNSGFARNKSRSQRIVARSVGGMKCAGVGARG